ncbi:MAG: VCBS repeat-containing protein, partial [Bacteroidota bacterium]
HSDVLLHYGNHIAAYQVGRPDGFTGDGRATRVKSSYLTTKKVKGPGGTWWVSARDEFYVGDFSGDGKDDLIVVYKNGSTQRLGLLKSTDSGFECVRKYYDNLPSWRMTDGDRYYVADFNGDGKDDIYIFNAKNWNMGYVGMLRSTGNSLAYAKRYDRYLPGNYITDKDELYIADINGDKKEEFILFKRDTRTTRIYKSTGTGLNMSAQYFESLPGWTNKAKDKYMIADFNGDGKDDLVVFNGKNWNMEYMLLLRSDGNRLNYVKRYDDRLPNWNMSDNDKFYVADINGDRKDDLYVYNSSDWSTQWLGTLLSDGSGIEADGKQSDWIGGWNLGSSDKLIVDDRPTGYRDNLYVHNTNWFGYMWPHDSNGMYLKAMYKDYIHAFKHHDYGWY